MKHIWMAAILMASTALLLDPGRAAAQAGAGTEKAAAVQEKPAEGASKGNEPPPETMTVKPPVGALTQLEPVAEGEPQTEMLDPANLPEHDPLLDPKPLPRASVSLIGGIARKVDAVHNRITVQPFGGGNKYTVYFDERTRILLGGRETTVLGIHAGDRVYVDSQVLGAHVFARTIQVRSSGGVAEASGQVTEVMGGEASLLDRLSGQSIRFAITERTKIESIGGRAAGGELHPGSLIDVVFTPGGRRSEAQSITVRASPGEVFVFSGVLTNVNLRDGVLALDNQADGNNYELSFDPLAERNAGRLVAGTPVSVTANFDGKRYRATSITVAQTERSDR